MRKFLAAAAGIVVVLAGFAGAAHSSATIDLIWLDTGTNEIEVFDDEGPQEIQLNVFLTAGPADSEGAGVSVDFSELEEAIEEEVLVREPLRVGNDEPTPANTPSRSPDPPLLPIEIESPQIRVSRVELINAVCFCDQGYGTGLEAGQSHQLGYVTFNVRPVSVGRYEILSDADGPSDGVLDGNTNDVSDSTTFNSAFITIPEPSALPVLGSGTAMLALLYRRRRYSAEP
jgi:hypothetical protein